MSSERSKSKRIQLITSIILTIVAIGLTAFAWNPDRNMLWLLLAFILWIAAFVEFAMSITKSSVAYLVTVILIWLGADVTAIAFIVRLVKTIIDLF